MRWFTNVLARHDGASEGVRAFAQAMREWFSGEGLVGLRSCTFVNDVSERGPVTPAVVEVTCRHMQQMT